MNLHFSDSDEVKDIFDVRNPNLAITFMQEIEKAYHAGKRNAVLLTITVDGSEEVLEASLNRSDWTTCLEACMEIFRKNDMVNEAIDTYTLKKKVEEA